MKLLSESTFTDSLKNIKVGDVLEVNTNKKEYFDVISTSGEELMVKKENDVFLLRKNAFQNSTLEFFIKGSKDFNKRGSLRNVKFLRVLRDGKTIDRITDSETDKDRKSISKQLAPQVKRQKERKFQFISDIQGLNVGDKLNIITGKVSEDGRIIEDSKNKLEFVVMGLPKKNNFYLEFIKVEGPNSNVYNGLENIDLLLINPKSPIITSHGDTIKVRLFSNDKNYTINDVLDLQKEKVDNSTVVTKDDILNNKYFRNAMIKDASWLRKLFGSNTPKGIIPAMQKLKGGSNVSQYDRRIKKNQKILFTLVSEEIGIGSAIIKNEKRYYGRVKDDFSFKVPIRGEDYKVYAKFDITGKDTIRENTFNVNISLIKDERGYNDVTNKYTGKIKILSYNY